MNKPYGVNWINSSVDMNDMANVYKSFMNFYNTLLSSIKIANVANKTRQGFEYNFFIPFRMLFTVVNFFIVSSNDLRTKCSLINRTIKLLLQNIRWRCKNPEMIFLGLMGCAVANRCHDIFYTICCSYKSQS